MKKYFKELFSTQEFYIGMLVGTMIMTIAVCINLIIEGLIK